jgi:hypothetical protein
MNTTETMEGKCLCGAVSVRAKAIKDVEACHCGMCRRWGGGPLMTVHCGPDVQITGNDKVGIFTSSVWAERAFCKACGTHLFYRLKQANEYAVSAGLFQDQEGLELKEQIFIDKKPAYYDFANQTPVLTEEQVFKKFAPQ